VSYIYRCAAIVPGAMLSQAASLIAAVLGDPPGVAEGNFSVRLSATGSEPATHLGGCGALTEEQKTDLVAAFAGVPWAIAFIWHATTNQLVAVANVTVVASGQPWSWQQSLESLSMQRIQEVFD
jgi:hypothetical protein